MWWLNWTTASKGHMQVPYNGKCTGIVLVLGRRRQQQQLQPFSSLLLAHAFLSFCHRYEVSLFACIYLRDCLRGTIFCVSIGLSLFVFTMFVSRSIHQFADEREYGTWIDWREEKKTQRTPNNSNKNYTGCQFKGHWFRAEKWYTRGPYN